ncbi:DUF3019 domain-containing protein [Aestuariibacter halophilus]|uniref:DUF3019 domain-containing protein n=1 Tax=Fluctibacter halophilus TaxID=226011 RepID=A0ABS8G4C0_9ALTE|nr:DUF3019 domain-containing protein [Aestuariibacter halophilus]MCC2614981.1 DUF3019 domain-containing protein [Aestuariibacter halophilus]
MVILKGLRPALLGLSLCLTAPVNAQQQPMPPRVASLIASPGTCELAQDQVSCDINAAFIWEAPTQGAYCLWESGSQIPMACWSDAWTGTFHLPFVAGEDRHFELRRKDSVHILATSTIRVIGAVEQRLRARRRHRLWRMF